MSKMPALPSSMNESAGSGLHGKPDGLDWFQYAGHHTGIGISEGWIGGISCLVFGEASRSGRRRPPCVPFTPLPLIVRIGGGRACLKPEQKSCCVPDIGLILFV